jgi:macrodomain Ter protein organizer (MatP/YcbG family)
MEYKGLNYNVVQTANPSGWKWTVWLDETRTKSGTSFSRASAMTFAQQAIEKIIKKSARPVRASMLNASPTLRQAN